MIDYRRIGEFPRPHRLTATVEALLGNFAEQVEPEPEELQRGEVCSEEWARGIIASILLKLTIEKFTWSKQAKSYKAKNIYGKWIKASYKNLDSLQRYTSMKWFHLEKISVPTLFPLITWDGEQVDLSGMYKSEIELKYPGLLQQRFYNVCIDIDSYGEESKQLTPIQETYLFKHVLNNSNKMNSQQWRNPTNSEIASTVRLDARLKPIKLFKRNLFLFDTDRKKMVHDEFYAMTCQFILYGPSKSLTKNPLDEMYEMPQLEKGFHVHSTEYKKSINIRTYARAYANFMYNILKSEDNISLMDKSYAYSLLYYTHIHMKSGIQNLFQYDKLREQFFDYHLDLVTPPKGVKGSTEFRDCLRSNGDKNLTRATEIWEEKLNISEELKYIIVRDDKRTFTKQEIAIALKRQGNVDPIDGLPLSLADAIGGHNVAWSKGGLTILDNCIAIRKEYNDDMGTKTLEEYKEELETIS